MATLATNIQQHLRYISIYYIHVTGGYLGALGNHRTQSETDVHNVFRLVKSHNRSYYGSWPSIWYCTEFDFILILSKYVTEKTLWNLLFLVLLYAWYHMDMHCSIRTLLTVILSEKLVIMRFLPFFPIEGNHCFYINLEINSMGHFTCCCRRAAVRKHHLHSCED